MKGKGCNHCNKKGYRGRMGIYELMTMTPQVREMTFKGESTQNVRKMARKQGMHTLFEDGMIKAIKGMTTIDEVLRITQQETSSEPSRCQEVKTLTARRGPTGSPAPARLSSATSARRGRADVPARPVSTRAGRLAMNHGLDGGRELGPLLDPSRFHRDNDAASGAAAP